MRRTDIRTIDGRLFDIGRPHDTRMSIEAIAHALAHICRFTGHVREHYSVAQHCWIASHLVPKHLALAGLMHDAPEAAVNDLSSPLKQLCPDYKDVEREVSFAMLQPLGLWMDVQDPEIKRIDQVLRATEQRDIQGHYDPTNDLAEGIEPLPWTIEPLPAWMAKELFLRRWRELRFA